MAITTIDQVKAAAHLTDEYTDDEILLEIDIVTAELYNTYKLPKRNSFSLDEDYTDYYIYANPLGVHEIIRLQAQVETDVDISGYTTLSSSSTTWSHVPPNSYLTITSTMLSTYDTKSIRVQHIPKIYNLMATCQVALNLIDKTSIVDGENVATPQSTKLKEKLKRYKLILKPKGMTLSGPNLEYDPYEYISLTQSELR